VEPARSVGNPPMDSPMAMVKAMDVVLHPRFDFVDAVDIHFGT